MGFRINQNIGAMVALNNLQKNDMGINKSIERLSTGLRIVRAADDPSGLVISERFRAQVEGIGQAVRNSQDGINMVQTAEGALDEVSNILRNMRNVALHAANTGPNDADTLQADQNQIGEAIKTLDRIASTTQFGAKKILDGSAGVQGTVSSADLGFVSGTTDTQAGTYTVDITTAAARGSLTSHASGTAAGRTAARVSTTGTGAALTAAETLTISGTNVDDPISIDLSLGATANDIRDAINNNADAQALGLTASVVGGQIQLDQDRLGSGNTSELDIAITNNGNGTAAFGAGSVASTSAATGATKFAEDELLTFSNGSNQVNVAITAGTSMSAAVSQINKALDNASIGITASFDNSTAQFTLTNDEYGGSSTVNNTFSSNRAGANSTGLALSAGSSINLANANTAVGGAAGTNGADVAGTIGGNAATGSGQFLTGNAGTAVDGLTLKYTSNVTAGADQGSVTVTNNSLNFQIGAFAGQTASLAISSMASTNLGTAASGTTTLSSVSLANIDVTSFNGEGAQDAIRVIDDAISQVTELRSQLGSFQKDILESTVSTLGVAKQNLASSESNIRDADFAEEMMKNSRSQILSQTGMSMLTQANQSGQAVMSLFR